MRARVVVPLSALCALALGVSVVRAGLYDADLSASELRGPEQPISFSHKKHAGELKIDCLYCHGAAEKSQAATVPAVSVCMGCHQHVKHRTSDDPAALEASTAEIAKLQGYWDRGESIPWIKIHNLPEFVQFKHFKHVQAGLACQTCHGQVQEMNRVYLAPDTRYTKRSFFLPTAKLEMGWCMECHLQRGAPDDCGACHH
jgi:hypothetical protein